MHQVTARTIRKGKIGMLPATIRLALWQMRQVWRIFALVTLGMIAAVVLVGTTPLFASVNTTASLRATFANSDLDPASYAQATIEVLDPSAIDQATQHFQQVYQHLGAPFFDLPPTISIHLELAPVYQGSSQVSLPQQALTVHGFDIKNTASHVHLLQGRLPQVTAPTANNVLEIALTEANATALGAHIGSTYTILAAQVLGSPPHSTPLPMTLKVVGILHNLGTTTFLGPFWHGEDLNFHASTGQGIPNYDNVMASNAGLLAFFQRISQAITPAYLEFPSGAHIYAYFPLDMHAITNTTINKLQTTLDYFTNVPPYQPFNAFVDKISVDNTNLTQINAVTQNMSSVIQVPVLALLGLMVGMILFFVTLMTELLVTRQAEAIAIMRSRGATTGQIFLIFVMQSLLLGLLTLLIAPLLIPLIIRAIVIMFFPPIVQSSLATLPTTPWEVLLALGWYIWVAILLVILTMCLAVWRTLRNSTLGRSTTTQKAGTQRPLWQRLYADVIIALLGMFTYGFYTYLTSIGIIDAQLQVTLAAPCMLVAATLLCLAAILLVLRLFPRLIQRGATLAARRPGLVPLFSLVMTARAPRQAMRTTILLIFTIAFALFAQVFLATQTQRAVDIANYVLPTDFNGSIVFDSKFHKTFAGQETQYQSIPGVLSASMAYVGDESFQNADTFLGLTVIATDPDRIATSIIWPSIDNPATIKTALAHLSDQRTYLIAASKSNIRQKNLQTALPPIPAIVSASASKALHLSVGKIFFINTVSATKLLAFIDTTEVPFLPGVPDITNDQGILVDYASFKPAYNMIISAEEPLIPTTAWLRTRQDPASLKSVQQALSAGPLKLTSLLSHQHILAGLQDDPLYLNLLCTLGLGIGLMLLLTCIGTLTSAWSYVRIRLRSLLVLRALGCTPVQLGLILTCEQAIIYAIALILGIGCGIGFTILALPNMIFSSTAAISAVTSALTLNIFQLQSTPLLLIVIPSTVIIGLGVVIVLCAIGIGLTATMVIRLSPAQMLRLSEDYVEEASLRPDEPKARPQVSNQEALSGKRQTARHALELGRALMPVRRSWSTLGLTLLGVLVSVLFICVVPLFSQVATTAGLHDVLSSPQNHFADVTNNVADTIPLGHIQAALAQGTTTSNKIFLENAGTYFHTNPIVTLSNVHIDAHDYTQTQPAPASQLTFASTSAAALASQVQILQGQLPQQQVTETNGKLPIMLTKQAAAYLHVHIGTVLTRAQGYPLDMQLVALFQPLVDAMWLPTTNGFFYYRDPLNLTSGVITALTTTEALALAADAQPQGSSTLTAVVAWNYAIDENVTSQQLPNLVTTLSSLRLQQWSGQTDTFSLSEIQTPLDALQRYQQGIAVSSIPILCTSILIIALLLLFLNFMVGLQVEREAGTIAILRSRGATQRQIFAAFLTRTLLINGSGWLAAMLLALPVTIVLTRLALQPADQAGLHLLTDHPWQTAGSLIGFATASIGITLLMMGLMLAQATRTDYLALRREITRATRKSLWQRWYLDVVGIILALTAYGFSLYLTTNGILDPAVNVQVKSPLVLTATVCLVLACTLVLLRLFPLLLRMGTRIAMRNRGIESMLALSYMAHAPRQRLRTALLLLLTTAFVVFAVIFNASQTQHIKDTAHYWVGGDFSGLLSQPLAFKQVKQTQHAYQQIKGVTTVAFGKAETVQLDSGNKEMQMQAVVDPQSFMQAVQWSGMNTRAQQATLIAHLNHPYQFPELMKVWSNTPVNAIPAIIATSSARTLGVQIGQTFIVNATQGQLTIFVVAIVDGMPDGTIVVNYADYNLAYLLQGNSSDISQVVVIDYIWIKTDGSTQSLQSVRQTLKTGPLHLSAFYDQQATIQNLVHNPLNLNLVGILALGTFAPLLLTWIGCLMASLVEMRQRQLLLGILRALGSTPAQLARVLAWEQTLIFGMSIVLGTLFGLLTAFLALPSLVLTSVLPQLFTAGGGSLISEPQDLFSWQNTPAANTVIPPLLGVVVALLAVLALLAVILMTRIASNIALGQALRLNED
jgi:ABC-type lipoprotein release transport system permease subunit